MKIGLTLLVAISSITVAIGNKLAATIPTDSTIKVLVLPPFDEIANAGVSPDIRKNIESSLIKQKQFSVIPFPFKGLMGVPYQMVFDKKYCKPILDKVDCDVIIMSQLTTANERSPGIWPWSYRVRIYNARTGKQLNSIQGDKLKEEDLRGDISSKVAQLMMDIKRTFKAE